MSKIILSYRRSDTQAVAGRIVDRLTAHFGEQSVFMDVDNIPFGIDFREHIKSALSQADVMIAVVGLNWLGVDPDGRTRLQEEDDPVRVEIETALRLNLLVIPVLVNGAGMPTSATLPESLKGFAFLNAAPVDIGRDFRPHVDRLIESIEAALAKKSGRPDKTSAPPPKSWLRANAGLMAAMVPLFVFAGAAAWELRSMILPAPAINASAPAQPSAANPSGTPAPTPVVIAPSPQPAQPSADDVQWGLLKNTTDIELLRRFIAQNPQSKHLAEAEQRIATLAAPSTPAVTPPVAVQTPETSPTGNDDTDWNVAKAADTYDVYQAYLKAHPQGRHVAAARRQAAEVRPIANALAEEPAIGQLPKGAIALVDDHSCKRGEIKVITGGDVVKKISRTSKCVSRDRFP